jgi:serine/threonine protein kinase
MSANRDREEEIFDAARELAPDERAAYLAERCGQDADLHQRIEGMLAADGAAGDFFKTHDAPSPTVILADASRSPSIEKPGDRIGRYKLLQQIGEGGMGLVYMAEQDQPVRRSVALKIIKLGMDTRQVVARFEAERQALAMMNHPHIAKVFDAGATDSGRPYFVMELVRGISITEYCDKNCLPTRERLDLFILVCQAVQHAHQKGVIHRDLKPSNILVTLNDGVPWPMVIDFGIAKATNQRLTEKTLFTDFAQMIGTPAYMSPEQAEMSKLDVDTRTDIYALGVLLYELLTGSTPFSTKELLSLGYREMQRTIAEREPPRLSTRLSTMANEERTVVAKNRSVDGSALAKLFRGDLDWIVMKCLEKDRTRRYETANGLAADIQRHLKCEPVVARPPSRLYEFQKTVRRHKFGFAAAGALVMMLLLGVIGSTWQAMRATRAEREQSRLREAAQKAQATEAALRLKAEADEKKAETEAARSKQVAQFMMDMLNGVGPGVALGRDTKLLREILDQTARRLNDLKGQPAVEADLRSVLGGVYYELGESQSSEAMYRAALALRLEIRGNKHGDVARSLSDVGEALRKQSRYDEAEPLFVEALAMQRELLGNSDPEVARTLYRLGMIHTRQQQGTKAEPLFREALVIFRQHPSEDLRGPLDQLGLSLARQGKYAEAESIADECVALCRKLAPLGDPLLAGALYHVGLSFRWQGKHVEAEPYLREALEIRRKQLPRDHEDTLWSIYALASSLIACNRNDEAAPLVDEFVRLAEGKAHMRDWIRRLIGDRAKSLRQAGRFREAVPDFEKLTKLDTTNQWNWYEATGLYLYVGDVERYRSACRDMLDDFEKVAADDPEIASMVAKACALAPDSVPDFSRVERLAERCMTGTEKHEHRRWFIHAKALTDYRAGHHEQAVGWLKRFAPKAGGTHWDASAFVILAMAHHQLGHADEASAALGAARGIHAKKPPDAMRDWSWRDWLHGEILCREADALLEPDQKPKTDSAR